MFLKRYILPFLIAFSLFSCNTNKQAIKSEMEDIELIDEEKLTWGKRDTSSQNIGFDGSGEGIFGRKIIYRDLSGLKSSLSSSGIIGIIVCINKEGLVNYAAILKNETTITDKNALKNYLKAASGYKYQPSETAPNEQCGKMKFSISNTINGRL